MRSTPGRSHNPEKQASALVSRVRRWHRRLMRLNEDHHALRESVRRFVEAEVNPYVDSWEAAGHVPLHELFPKAAKLGLLGLEYDTAFGGEGADHSFQLVAAEEYGRMHAGGVAMAIGVQAMMATPSLHDLGSPELK